LRRAPSQVVRLQTTLSRTSFSGIALHPHPLRRRVKLDPTVGCRGARGAARGDHLRERVHEVDAAAHSLYFARPFRFWAAPCDLSPSA
jgi:hypothetical protein